MIVIHLLIYGGVDLTSRIPYLSMFNLGAFLVWIPLCLVMPKNLPNNEDFLLVAFKHNPAWLTILNIIGVINIVVLGVLHKSFGPNLYFEAKWQSSFSIVLYGVVASLVYRIKSMNE